MTTPTCFISYSWDSENHKRWVRSLAERIQQNGAKVLLDQWDLQLGADLPKYMETSVRDADFVLLVCTPSFAKKANLGQGGVGYEKSIVTGEVFSGYHNPAKFVPVLRAGDQEESLPSYLKPRLFVDFRENNKFKEAFEELLRHIHRTPRHSPPPVGNKPIFSIEKNNIGRPEIIKAQNKYCAQCGAVPGEPTKCPGWTSHHFVKSSGDVYCAHCGAVPGKSTQCPGWTVHHFVKGLDNAYCAQCGAVPGEPTKCPGWTQHHFIE